MKQDVFTRRQHTFLVLDADSLIETLQSMALFLPPFGSEDVIAATLACMMKNALHNSLHLFLLPKALSLTCLQQPFGYFDVC
jgi:hypothetical protein